MDNISKRYVEMVEKAKEFRSDWFPRFGDYAYNYEKGIGQLFLDDEKTLWIKWGSEDKPEGIMFNYDENSNNEVFRPKTLFLPRLRALEKMVLSTSMGSMTPAKFYQFREEWKGMLGEEKELWFAYFMKVKYGKHWDFDRRAWINE
ncbi:MAG: hypothetical protein KAQ99_00770 [Candidatus Aureabacteria bacterium]|nr:hypothetical protein [Candidatus Auribacterota bacterium]MCK5160084.1 hypothetical protein [Candidatus Auribacterota bacterium]